MSGENILHFGAFRMRAVGSGSVQLTFYGYDDILTATPPVLSLSSTNSKELLRLLNFQSQAGRFKLASTTTGDSIKVNHISVFIKPLWSEHPA